jgi:hypothetical protein
MVVLLPRILSDRQNGVSELPAYSVMVDGDVKDVRGGHQTKGAISEAPKADATLYEIPEGGTLTLRLRPDAAPAGGLEVKTFVSAADGTSPGTGPSSKAHADTAHADILAVEPLQTHIEISESGGIRVRAAAKDLFAQALSVPVTRPRRVDVVVYRPSHAALVEGMVTGAADSGPGWRRFSVNVKLKSDGQ